MRQPSTRSLSVFMSLMLTTGALALLSGRGEAGAPQGDDPLGAWKLTYTSPDGKARECVVVVSRQGQFLRGDYSDGKTTRPARDVAYQGGELSFWVDGKYARQVYTLTYKGRPQGNALRGAVYWKYGWASGSFNFVGKRLSQGIASVP